ncbi:MAG TPA: CapA family protein [Candidatus Aveggerthella stercoripullorum]|uniref:CapA family protein n=1 Tax=Candidatus Aveggerthella stercoripullorum TaxID=2840688 RepID=A0A9D1D3Q3_9ACTN|nr:CapA family protein [Candidatus Aveggerthella stercoripullorum]
MGVRIMAVGDDLIHKQLYEAARLPEGGYCFDGMFDGVRGLIARADVRVINQETILVAGEAQVSSFPAFGSPVAVGQAAVNAGFNVVTHASNHALDKGLDGIADTLAFWELHEDDVCMLGLHPSAADQERVRIITVDGVKIALVNCTEKLNFRRLPRSARYCVDVMKGFSRRALAERIGRARQEADFVIVFPHWGCEYLYEPIEAQRKWATFFAEAGADLIIGTHPHVVQPVEWVERGDGGRTLCYYSLGNFISCQVGAGTMLGALADVTLERTGDGVRIASHDIMPLVTHTDAAYRHFVTYPLADYTDEMAAENKIFAVVERAQGIHVDCAYLGKLFDDILNYRAQAYNKYKSPWDVNRGNLKGVLNALRGKNVKA